MFFRPDNKACVVKFHPNQFYWCILILHFLFLPNSALQNLRIGWVIFNFTPNFKRNEGLLKGQSTKNKTKQKVWGSNIIEKHKILCVWRELFINFNLPLEHFTVLIKNLYSYIHKWAQGWKNSIEVQGIRCMPYLHTTKSNVITSPTWFSKPQWLPKALHLKPWHNILQSSYLTTICLLRISGRTSFPDPPEHYEAPTKWLQQLRSAARKIKTSKVNSISLKILPQNFS